MVKVPLDHNEQLQGAHVGIMRNVESHRLGRKTNAPETWESHIIGALGELVFAKHMELHWSGAHDFRAPDVGPWEVRARGRHEFWNKQAKKWEPASLLVQRDDKLEAPYVLVTGNYGEWHIHGWILGRDCRNEDWFKDPGLVAGRATGRPCFMVPQSKLNPCFADYYA